VSFTFFFALFDCGLHSNRKSTSRRGGSPPSPSTCSITNPGQVAFPSPVVDSDRLYFLAVLFVYGLVCVLLPCLPQRSLQVRCSFSPIFWLRIDSVETGSFFCIMISRYKIAGQKIGFKITCVSTSWRGRWE